MWNSSQVGTFAVGSIMPACSTRIIHYSLKKIGSILFKVFLEVAGCSFYHFTSGIINIRAIVYTPVTIAGNLATNSTNCISQHHRWNNSIYQMHNLDILLISVHANCDSSGNQSSIKSKSTGREYSVYWICDKLIPILQVIKQFGTNYAKDKRNNHDITYPVVRPDANAALLGSFKLLLILFPPF